MVLERKERVCKSNRRISSNTYRFSCDLDVQAALKLFTMDRTSTQLEKDLIKTVKDQEVSRNLPSGKVKFVLPSYLKLK